MVLTSPFCLFLLVLLIFEDLTIPSWAFISLEHGKPSRNIGALKYIFSDETDFSSRTLSSLLHIALSSRLSSEPSILAAKGSSSCMYISIFFKISSSWNFIKSTKFKTFCNTLSTTVWRTSAWCFAWCLTSS